VISRERTLELATWVDDDACADKPLFCWCCDWDE